MTKQKGYDVAVCGHVHQPKISENYMNSGDFCENSTCLVEDFDGNWFLIEVKWTGYHFRLNKLIWQKK